MAPDEQHEHVVPGSLGKEVELGGEHTESNFEGDVGQGEEMAIDEMEEAQSVSTAAHEGDMASDAVESTSHTESVTHTEEGDEENKEDEEQVRLARDEAAVVASPVLHGGFPSLCVLQETDDKAIVKPFKVTRVLRRFVQRGNAAAGESTPPCLCEPLCDGVPALFLQHSSSDLWLSSTHAPLIASPPGVGGGGNTGEVPQDGPWRRMEHAVLRGGRCFRDDHCLCTRSVWPVYASAHCRYASAHTHTRPRLFEDWHRCYPRAPVPALAGDQGYSTTG